MRILLTGGTGFTGRALMEIMDGTGYDIHHLVRKTSGFRQEHLWDFVGDLPKGLPDCDAVVHLAAYVHFGTSLETAQYMVNTVSTAKLTAYAGKRGAYFILASMVGIHGPNQVEIGAATPGYPNNHYALSKYLAEEVIRTFAEQYSILRIGGIYGLDGPVHLGLNKAISGAFHRKESPVLRGSGLTKRNYISVHDVARWILYLLKRYASLRHNLETKPCEILYLAGPEVMSIEEYLTHVVEILLPGKEIQRIEGPESKDAIVVITPFPFEPLTFRQYLRGLRTEKGYQEI